MPLEALCGMAALPSNDYYWTTISQGSASRSLSAFQAAPDELLNVCLRLGSGIVLANDPCEIVSVKDKLVFPVT